MKQKLKKLTKIVLCAMMLVTGFVMNPLDINANDVELAGAQPTISVITKSYTVSGWDSPSITVNLSFYLDNNTQEMSFKNVTCTKGTQVKACSISGSATGKSQVGSYQELTITVNYSVTNLNNQSWNVVYKFIYKQNQLQSKYMYSES